MLRLQLVVNKEDKKFFNQGAKRLKEGIKKPMSLIKTFILTQVWSHFVPDTGRFDSFLGKRVPMDPFPPPGPLVSRTGTLQRSIKASSTDDSLKVGTNCPYGIIHEILGVRKSMNGGYPRRHKSQVRPFLMPAFEGENWDFIEETLTRSIISHMCMSQSFVGANRGTGKKMVSKLNKREKATKRKRSSRNEDRMFIDNRFRPNSKKEDRGILGS